MHNELTILVVDDDTNDIHLFRIALRASPFGADLRVAHSGLEALKYLSGYGVFVNRAEFPLPDIVLLDLHMPGVDGLAVLRWIRRQRLLAGLPVIVFTGDERLRPEALKYGADIYMCKEEGTGELLALLQQINLNWPSLNVAVCQEKSGSLVSRYSVASPRFQNVGFGARRNSQAARLLASARRDSRQSDKPLHDLSAMCLHRKRKHQPGFGA